MKNIIAMRFINRFLLVAIAFLTWGSIYARPPADTLRVLLVGNSYTYSNNMPQIISILSDSASVKLFTRKSTIGGASLKDHWHGERGLQTQSLIREGQFDIVVLQEQSMGTIHQPDTFLLYVRKFSDLIKEAGARPYLYLTWAREKMPQMQEQITSVYQQAAGQNGATVVPVGPAWMKAREIRPGMPLYGGDGSHPSQLGAFLTASVFVQAILQQPLPKMPNKDYTGESLQLFALDPLDVDFCQGIAGEIAKSE